MAVCKQVMVIIFHPIDLYGNIYTIKSTMDSLAYCKSKQYIYSTKLSC